MLSRKCQFNSKVAEKVLLPAVEFCSKLLYTVDADVQAMVSGYSTPFSTYMCSIYIQIQVKIKASGLHNKTQVSPQKR